MDLYEDHATSHPVDNIWAAIEWKRANDALPKRHLAQNDRQVAGKPIRTLHGRRTFRRNGRSVYGSPNQVWGDRGSVVVLGQHANAAISVALKFLMLDSLRRQGLIIRRALPRSASLATTLARGAEILRCSTSC